MAVTSIQIRRRVSGATGAPGSLQTAEPAYNMADGKIYVGFGDNGSGVATSIKAIAADNFVANVPGGGTTGQVLAKASNTSGDWTWSAAGATYTAGTGLTLTTGTFAVDFTVVAPLASPTFTGTPAAPTPSTADNTTKIATTAYVQANLSSYLTSAAAASTYAPLASPTLTGTPKAPTPTAGDNSTNIATTAYVQTAIGSSNSNISWKPLVRAAATTNVASLSAPQTIDGVSLIAGDRVLLAGQSTASQNGVYVVAAGAWSRATDMAAWSQVPGATVMVDQGTAYSGHGFTCTNDVNTAGTIGTTAMTFIEFTGATDITAGNGVTKSGNTLSAVVTGAGLTLGGSGIALSGNASALAGLTGAADTGLYFTGSGTMGTYTQTAFSRTLQASVAASNARTTLGLGTMSTQDASAVAITGGTIAGVVIDGGTF